MNYVPRARHVGQLWVTSVFTSIQSLFGSLKAVLSKPLPDAVTRIFCHSKCRFCAMVQGHVSLSVWLLSSLEYLVFKFQYLIAVLWGQIYTYHICRIICKGGRSVTVRENTFVCGRSFFCSMAGACKEIPTGGISGYIGLDLYLEMGSVLRQISDTRSEQT